MTLSFIELQVFILYCLRVRRVDFSHEVLLVRLPRKLSMPPLEKPTLGSPGLHEEELAVAQTFSVASQQWASEQSCPG